MPQSETERKIVDGRLWHEFCDRLKASGDAILQAGTPDDVFTRAEGWRYLTRVLRAGLESAVEFGDPRRPGFYQLSNETIKIGNDNPDNIYHNTTISGAHEYKITGTRGSVPFISFGSKSGGFGSTGDMRPTGQLELHQMQVAPDGTFEVHVSCAKQPGNWLPLQPDSSMIIVRQTFQDRDKEEPATYSIERIGQIGDTHLDVDLFPVQLMNAVDFVEGTANVFVEWMLRYEKHQNELPSDDQELCQRMGGDRTIHYLQSYWKLEEDEALVFEAKQIPDCTSWNLQLSNFWMESLDYLNHRIHINKHTAAYESDGSVQIVLAHRDPGPEHPNWLTTQGHSFGGMLWRWIEADEHPPVDTRVVKFAEL